jgi:uncharacterized protein DUF4154
MAFLISRTLLLAVLLAAGALGQAPDEYQVKAAFLYNFVKFVEWPPQVFKSPTDGIAICILGQDPFGGALDEAVRGKTFEGRTVVVARIAEVRQAGGCRILFVSASESKRARAILTELEASSILTVGDTEGFAAEGGVIDFRLEAGRVRFRVNVDAAERARLKISSKLLSLAQLLKK